MVHLRRALAMPAAASTTLVRRQAVLHQANGANRGRGKGRMVQVDEVDRVDRQMAHRAGPAEIRVQADLVDQVDVEARGAGLA